MDLTNYIPKGQLIDFPKEVIAKMLEYQVKQGNKEDISRFELNITAAKHYNNGFDWDNTIEGTQFWSQIILYKNFIKFFELYPKQEFKRGDLVEVSDDNREWVKRIYVTTIEGSSYPYVVTGKTVYKLNLEEGKCFNTLSYTYIRPIVEEQIVELTLEDISAGKGVGIPAHLLRIKK